MNTCVMITSSNKNNQPKWKAGTMETKNYRTKDEMADYFAKLADAFETEAAMAEDAEEAAFLRGKAEAYELAAFEVSHNM